MADRSPARTPAAATAAGPAPGSRAARNLAIGVAIFAVVFALAFRYLAIYHKSLVWVPDGSDQHFPALYYLNRIIRGFLHDPRAGFPFWSWDLGLGADTISTLSYYTFGDPFALVSLLFPMKSMELAFSVIFTLRLAVAGIFSAMYLRKMGSRSLATLVGSLVYCFTTFTMYFVVHQSNFGTALALFPLLLLGAEYALEHRRHWVLVLAVFASAVGNFYFFYMQALTLIIYAAARVIELAPRGQRLRRLALEAARMAGLVVLGLLFAGPVLIPTIAAVFTTARRQTPVAIPLLFPLREYGVFLASAVSTVIGPHSTVLGFAPVGFVVIPALFLRRGRHFAAKVMVAVFPLLIGIPALATAYNGFTFPVGRFGFEWGLFIALAVGLMLSDGAPFTRRELLGMGLGYAALMGLTLAAHPVTDSLLAATALGVATWCAFAWERVRADRRLARMTSRPEAREPAHAGVTATRAVVLVLFVAGVGLNAMFLSDVRYGKSLNPNLPAGQVLDEYLRTPGASARLVDDPGLYRIDNSEANHYNDAIVQGYSGTGFFFSIMNGALTNLVKENDVRGGWSSFSYAGMDDRTALDALLGVKYYVGPASGHSYVPFGYSRLLSRFGGTVYRNDYALPVGFVYDSVLRKPEFDALQPVDRQMAMLQGAVVAADAVPTVPAIVPRTTAVELPFAIASTTGLSPDLAAKRIVKLESRGRMNLVFSAVPDAETYLEIRDFEDTTTAISQPPGPLITWYSSDAPPKSERWQSPGGPYYWGNNSQLVNLGYRRSGITSASVTFDIPGVLTFSSLKVFALPMMEYPARVAKLRANSMRDVRVANNSLTGQVDATSAGLLFLSIPYSSGWRAYVDGRRVDTVLANIAFTGVPVAAGHHTVVMRYATPGLAAGLASFATGCVIALGLLVMSARRRSAASSGVEVKRRRV